MQSIQVGSPHSFPHEGGYPQFPTSPVAQPFPAPGKFGVSSPVYSPVYTGPMPPAQVQAQQQAPPSLGARKASSTSTATNDSSGGRSNTATGNAPTSPTTMNIRCCDPYNQKVYDVPSYYVEDTLGKQTYANNPSGRRAQICMKYQDGQCNMKSRCQQIHADRTWVQELRAKFYDSRKVYVSDITALDSNTGEYLAFKYSEVDNCLAKDKYRSLPNHERNGFVICKEYSSSSTCPQGRNCGFLHVNPEKYAKVAAQHAEKREGRGTFSPVNAPLPSPVAPAGTAQRHPPSQGFVSPPQLDFIVDPGLTSPSNRSLPGCTSPLSPSQGAQGFPPVGPALLSPTQRPLPSPVHALSSPTWQPQQQPPWSPHAQGYQGPPPAAAYYAQQQQHQQVPQHPVPQQMRVLSPQQQPPAQPPVPPVMMLPPPSVAARPPPPQIHPVVPLQQQQPPQLQQPPQQQQPQQPQNLSRGRCSSRGSLLGELPEGVDITPAAAAAAAAGCGGGGSGRGTPASRSHSAPPNMSSPSDGDLSLDSTVGHLSSASVHRKSSGHDALQCASADAPGEIHLGRRDSTSIPFSMQRSRSLSQLTGHLGRN